MVIVIRCILDDGVTLNNSFITKTEEIDDLTMKLIQRSFNRAVKEVKNGTHPDLMKKGE